MRLVENGQNTLNQYAGPNKKQVVTLVKQLITEMEKMMEVTTPSFVTLCSVANQMHENHFVNSTAYSEEKKTQVFSLIRKVWVHGEEFATWASIYTQVVIVDNDEVTIY